MSQLFIPADLPASVIEKLRCNYRALRTLQCARVVWGSCLTTSERTKLGGKFVDALVSVSGCIVKLWMNLRGVSAVRAIIDLSRDVNLLDNSSYRVLLAETREFSDDADEALAIAIARADLVLSDSPRSAYWKGVAIDIDWETNNILWGYFDALARAAKRGRGIDASVLANNCRPDYLSKVKSRLINFPSKTTANSGAFPVGLADRIVATPHRGQRLEIAPDRICILEAVVTETVREFV